MRIRVQKWGNSLALRIPKAFAQEAGLQDGSAVDMALADGRLVITAVKATSFTLDDLLAGVNEDNLHGEVDTGTLTGKEVW